MDRTDKKKKLKTKKEKALAKKPNEDKTKTSEGIPDVDFKKFLGCGG
ncbi:hypothetical protein N7E81_07560 [Reichenbachiella carrageenanivorans]|uniref:Uncharacterized protein n=1 Tax=Reichenbachiella carrageenanivorans TaxID=2979869 RepID=A0ABY6D5T3_9BACT|nr:hypothetical protein [Reichenbachiella carrageenanivorans]UXX80955.1 hypothetical protein N7E81_07560 [Reichenbachiella carrageenanivorans]